MTGKCKSFVDIVCFAFQIDVVTKCVRGQSTVDRSKNFVTRLFGFCGFDLSPYPDTGFEVTNHHGVLAYCTHFAANNQSDLSLGLYTGIRRPRKYMYYRTHVILYSITLHIRFVNYWPLYLCVIKNFKQKMWNLEVYS